MSQTHDLLGCTVSPVHYVRMRDISRRGFIAASVLALPILEACGASPADSPLEPTVPAPDAVEISDASIRIRLARVPSLAMVGGAFLVPGMNVIVLHVATREFRALSNICTHAGCGISHFIGGQLRCQCHGSEFGIDGRNIVGPATTPLRTFLTTLSDDRLTLSIAR